jgi:very-short-patch-repair endonuclease
MIDFNPQEAHRRYLNGESLTQIAQSYGMKKGDTLKARLNKCGIAVDTSRILSTRRQIDVQKLIELYRSGWSVKKLAEHFSADRNAIGRRLKENGITPRDRSESMFLRMEQTSPEERLRLTTAAHNSVRGAKRSIQEKMRRAAVREDIRYCSPIELRLINMLTDRGIKVIPQKAVGIYNIDIAIAPLRIAVEVYGGHWHAGGNHARRFRERFDFLINAGWTPIIVWVSKQNPLTRGAADYIVSIAEKLRLNEPVGRHEHVISGGGQPSAIGSSKLNYRT